MLRRITFFIGVGVMCLAFSASAFAQISMQIRESGTTRNQSQSSNWINLVGVTQEIGQEVSSASGTARRRATIKPISMDIRKSTDSATPRLIAAVTRGKVFPSVLIRHQEGSKTYTVSLTNVTFTNFIQTSDKTAWPEEQFSLQYEGVKWTYKEGNNSSETSWNIATPR
jgi:type VI secretion system Hcp family effector